MTLISDALDAFATAVTLIALAWVGIFGGVGAMLAYTHGQTPAAGLLWGLLGPFGWSVIKDRDEIGGSNIAAERRRWDDWENL
jgi:hypothetical protein